MTKHGLTSAIVPFTLALALACSPDDLEPAAEARLSTLGTPQTDRDHAIKAAIEARLAMDGLEQLHAQDEPEYAVLEERLARIAEMLEVQVPRSEGEVASTIAASPRLDAAGGFEGESMALYGLFAATHAAAENGWTWYRDHR